MNATPTPCDFTDIGCQVVQSLWTVVAPFILAIIIFVVAILVLPKAGKKGVVAAVVVIFFELWWFGLVPYLPALHTLFGV